MLIFRLIKFPNKFLLRFSIVLLVILFSFTIYLSYFGIETNKFDTLIKEKANEVNKNVKLEFNFSASGTTLFLSASPKYVNASSAPASASF